MKTNNEFEKKNSFFSFLAPDFTISSRIFFSVAVVVFLLKLIIAAKTVGTSDMLSMDTYANIVKILGGAKIYESLPNYNHPPFIIHFFNILKALESITKIEFSFWFRFASSLADFGLLVVLFKLSQLNTGLKITSLSIFLMLLAPISIIVAGFHGNTDPILMFFLVLSIYLIEVDKEVFYTWIPPFFRNHFINLGLTNLCLAGIAYGLSANIKVIAFIIAPCIFFYLSDNKKRLEYTLAALITWVLTSLPYIFLVPKYIIKHSFSYSSFYGFWGVSRLLTSLLPSDHWLNVFYSGQGKFLIIGVIILFTLGMNFLGKKPPLFIQVGCIFSIFLALTNGFGIQYLFWLAPWVLGLGIELALIYYVTTGIFGFMVYNYWSGGFPWYFASADAKPYDNFIILYEYVAWVGVLIIVLSYVLYIIKLKINKLDNITYNFVPKAFTLFTIFSLSILFLMAVNDLFVRKGFYVYSVEGETYELRQKRLSEATLIIMSRFYDLSGLQKESIDICNKILVLNPNNVDAYNNMCVAYNNLKDWENAILAGKKALAIDPNHQLAKNNLEWAKSHLVASGGVLADSDELLKQLKTPPGYFNASNFVNVGLELIQKGDNLNAIVAGEKALARDPKQAIAYNNLCIAYNNLFMYGEAEIACKKALELNSSFELAKNNLNFTLSRKSDTTAPKATAQTYINLGLAFINLNEFEKSVYFSQKAIELEPKNSIAYNNLCVAYNGLQNWDKAIEVGEKALSIDPQFNLAKNNLNWAKSQKESKK